MGEEKQLERDRRGKGGRNQANKIKGERKTAIRGGKKGNKKKKKKKRNGKRIGERKKEERQGKRGGRN